MKELLQEFKELDNEMFFEKIDKDLLDDFYSIIDYIPELESRGLLFDFNSLKYLKQIYLTLRIK